MVQEMEALATGHAAHLNIGAIPFVSGQMLSAAIGRTLPQGRGITATIHEARAPPCCASYATIRWISWSAGPRHPWT